MGAAGLIGLAVVVVSPTSCKGTPRGTALSRDGPSSSTSLRNDESEFKQARLPHLLRLAPVHTLRHA